MTTPTARPRPITISRPDIYRRVTDRILADLAQGVRPWAKPWHTAHRDGRLTLPRRHTGDRYRGINILLLWAETMTKGFSQPVWMTYRQATALKAQVRQGQHGALVVYADRFTKTTRDADGQEVETDIPFLKAYTVFNVEQIDGLPASPFTTPSAPASPLSLIDAAEAFFAATGATIRHGGHQAYYSPASDVIVLPRPEAFTDAAAYTSTKAHELTHWTKHASRLDRDLGGKRFGDDGYAREELVAELGAAFLCAELGVTAEPRADHAAYLADWLQILKADPKAMVQAASHAQKAVDYLRGLVSPVSTVTDDREELEASPRRDPRR